MDETKSGTQSKQITIQEMSDEQLLQVTEEIHSKFGKLSLHHRAVQRQFQQVSTELDQSEALNHELTTEIMKRGLSERLQKVTLG